VGKQAGAKAYDVRKGEKELGYPIRWTRGEEIKKGYPIKD